MKDRLEHTEVTGLLIAASAEEILIVSWLLLRMYRRRLVPWVVWPLPDVQHVGVDEAAPFLLFG